MKQRKHYSPPTTISRFVQLPLLNDVSVPDIPWEDAKKHKFYIEDEEDDYLLEN